jgi:O-antigen/teichoic acid export membrane protein
MMRRRTPVAGGDQSAALPHIVRFTATEPTQMRSDKKYLIKGSVLNLIGLVVRNISPVLVIILARLFPREVFGLFISVSLFALTASRLLVMGLDKGLIWYVPRNQKRGRPAHTGLVPVTVTTHLVAIGAWVLAALFIGSGGLVSFPTLAAVSPTFVTVCLLSVVPYMALHCFAAALEGIRRPEYKLFVNQFLATTLGPLSAIILFYAGVGDMSLALGFTGSNLLGALVLVFFVNRHFDGIRWRKWGRIDGELLRYSWPLGVAEAIASVLLRVDLWMILFMLGPAEAAVYAIMVTLSNGVKGIRQSFDPLIVPIVSKMKKEQRAAHLKEVYSYAVNMVTGIQFLVAFTVLFFPAEIMSIAGKSYTVQPQALSILLVGNLVNGFLALNGQVILGLGYSRVMLYLNTGTLLLNLALNYLLIPRLGITGAATATVLAYMAQCLMMYLYQKRLTGLHLYQRHLAVNALVIALFAGAAFGYQETIVALPLLHKTAGYAAALCGLGVLYLLKRKTFSLSSPGSTTA